MSVSTDGQLSYGYMFEEDHDFPWDGEDDYGDVCEWWLVESGWTWDGEQPFKPDGAFAPGFGPKDPRVVAYLESRRNWLLERPLPVEVVNYQSDSSPAYILAVAGTVLSASRGNPREIDPRSLSVPEASAAAAAAFVERYAPAFVHGPAWFLSSYWDW